MIGSSDQAGRTRFRAGLEFFAMSAAAERTVGAQVAESQNPGVLATISNPATTLAIWRRPLPSAVRFAAEAVCKTVLDYSSIFDPHNQADVDRVCADLEVETGAAISPIAYDLVGLACLFVDICDATPVRIRLETVEGDGCRRFHFDNVAMRLVVTYRGVGTQWVSPEYAAAAYAQQTDYNGPLNEIGAGDVALFRGKRSNVLGMTLHRSPPKVAASLPRLVGVIDCTWPERGRN